MNILFIQRTYNIGGVNVVTKELANFFVTKGHNVSVFVFSNRLLGTEKMIDKHVHRYLGINDCHFKFENVSALTNALKLEKPDLIVNNWGMPWMFITTIRWAQHKAGNHATVMSVYHNDPMTNGMLQSIDTALLSQRNTFKRLFLKIKRNFIRIVTALNMRYVYHKSDLYQLLSSGFVSRFQEFTKLNNISKHIVQTNPITIDSGKFELDTSKKDKEIIYIGRLDAVQKKVSRVIDTWALLEDKYPNWRLTIVGDGPERDIIETRIKTLNLKHVTLEGRKESKPFYERASIMLLTSDFEGFPLVLAEAMSKGCIPIVYESFVSVHDIITNDEDGIIVPNSATGFSPSDMALRVESIIQNLEKRHKLMNAAIEKSKQFSMENIYQQWEEKIFSVCKAHN